MDDDQPADPSLAWVLVVVHHLGVPSTEGCAWALIFFLFSHNFSLREAGRYGFLLSFLFFSFLTQLIAERSRSVNDQGGNGKEGREALSQAWKQVGGIGKPTAGNVGLLCSCFVLFCMYSNTLPLPGVFWDRKGRGVSR